MYNQRSNKDGDGVVFCWQCVVFVWWFGGIDIDCMWFCRYLTWDLAKFPNPETMQNKLAVKGRKVRGRGREGEMIGMGEGEVGGVKMVVGGGGA